MKKLLLIAAAILVIGAATTGRRKPVGIGGFSEDNTDDRFLINYEDYEESYSEEQVTNAIREIMDMEEFGRKLYACPYIGSTKNKSIRLGQLISKRKRQGKKPYSKLFLLARVTSMSKIAELEKYFIQKFGLELVLENRTTEPNGVVPATEYYLYIAVCEN